MISPSAETNDPEPPLLNRTADDRRCSAQPAGGSKPYLALSWASGKLLKTHMPSSPWAMGITARIARPIENINKPSGIENLIVDSLLRTRAGLGHHVIDPA